jgi:hypothetical protein
MKHLRLFLFLLLGFNPIFLAAEKVPANHPYIQYFGRWDMSDPFHPRHSWPGVSVYVEFSGTSIGVNLRDNMNYYNIYIDGKFRRIFHGEQSGDADYSLASGLEEGKHSLRFSKRNISFDRIFSLGGFILDDQAVLLPAPPKPAQKIEFVGDSFTAAKGNEATQSEMPWEEKFPVTNIDLGFAPVIARHFQAQYHTTCRSGSGMICDWRGKPEFTIPMRFDRTLMEASEPKWNFQQWIPDLMVICLGLNDYSGLKDKDGKITAEKSALFRKGYREFLATIRGVYPGVTIIAVAAHEEWIHQNVRQVVEEEKAAAHTDIFYAQFDRFNGGYVADGHPTVATHQKIADQIIEVIHSTGKFAKTEP